MSEKSKHLPERFDLTLLFELDLGPHQREFLLCLMAGEVASNFQELASSCLDLAAADELTRRVGHEGRQADEQDDAPWDLNSQRQTPLNGAIGGVGAGEAHPVGHHRPQGDTAAGDAANEAADVWSGNFAQIYGDGCNHSAV